MHLSMSSAYTHPLSLLDLFHFSHDASKQTHSNSIACVVRRLVALAPRRLGVAAIPNGKSVNKGPELLILRGFGVPTPQLRFAVPDNRHFMRTVGASES